jgi:O-antigen/teichoic acid export membrane protein
LIVLVYGTRWQVAAPILSLLALAAAFWPLSVLNLAALSARGRSDLFLKLEILKKMVSVVLVIISSPFGPVAVASVVFISSVYGAIINTRYSKRLLGYSLRAQLTDQRLTLLLCVLGAATGWAILHWTLPTLLHTIIAILIAAVVYIGGAFLGRSEALAELLSIGRTLLQSWRM